MASQSRRDDREGREAAEIKPVDALGALADDLFIGSITVAALSRRKMKKWMGERRARNRHRIVLLFLLDRKH